MRQLAMSNAKALSHPVQLTNKPLTSSMHQQMTACSTLWWTGMYGRHEGFVQATLLFRILVIFKTLAGIPVHKVVQPCIEEGKECNIFPHKVGCLYPTIINSVSANSDLMALDFGSHEY
jgi:hypothetical protein